MFPKEWNKNMKKKPIKMLQEQEHVFDLEKDQIAEILGCYNLCVKNQTSHQ